LKVLVADDSITVRKIAERQLTAAGFEVTLAANGEEALAWLDRGRPDLIISDVIMPDKSGYDVCAFVRSHAGLAATPVLLISGIVNDEVTRRARSCQADGVLKKPFQGSSLPQQVTALLSARAQFVRSEENLETPEAAPSTKPAVEPGTSTSSGSKVYRITDEQLHGFRQTVARVRELEKLLAEERAYSAQLVKHLLEAEQLVGRASGLYDQLQRLLQEAIRAADRVRERPE
jgi:DNA-binding response OmpR family regulator